MDVSKLWSPVTRWAEFRRRQLEALEESNRIAAQSLEGADEATDRAPRLEPSVAGPDQPDAHHPDRAADATDVLPAAPFGVVGRPLNRHSPFYIGFFGATGALLAVGLWQLAGRLSTTITVLIVSVFLALALNPIVDRLVSRGMRRAGAVTVVFGSLIVAFVLIGALVIPPVVEQGAQLAQLAPGYAQDVLNSRWLRELDRSYDVIDRVQEEVTARMSDERFLEGVLGGILGAGRAVFSGLFQVFTVLVLTLYFLSSLPRVKHGAYAVVPATRRARVVSLSEEIMRRVGSYAIGQVGIATLNAVLSYVMMTIVGIPYAAVLAVTVGLLGLIPMIGATLGAVIVCIVAFFVDPTKALIAAVYYVVYQQIENYLVAPRVMQHTVSVPGPVTIVAALAGAALLGVLGALLAIPVAAGLLLLYEEVLVPRQ
ncbi:MAG TPA: AI-2E family transporter, partial [Ornithinibacter sp.]|nr:AI-2E family transporter [Ornithinibacter sp.]